MEAALRFYRDLLGMRVAIDTEMGGEMLAREVAVDDPHLRLVMLVPDEGDAYFLELLQYTSPPGESHAAARPNDPGAHHVALTVADIREAYRSLSDAGVHFTCEPQEVDAGMFAGHWTAYCYDPDGMIVELWQLPAEAS
jgi:catechol 2,3-dioxygenase-like lactoylglutathione lyase family enzyme